MTRRHLRRIEMVAGEKPARAATIAHMLHMLADRVESGEVTANFHVAFVPGGEMWMLSAMVETPVDRE